MIQSLMKGFINARPKRHIEIKKWSIDRVLQTIENWGQNWNLEPKLLTWKLATLLAFTSSNRVSELRALDVNLMYKKPDGIVFHLKTHKKNRKSSVLPGSVFYPSYPENKLLCPCKCLEVYLEKTKKLRTEGKDPLFRAIVKPHHQVTTNTISNWISRTIAKAGYDIKENQKIAHSARGKSATKAERQGKVSLEDIMKTAEWKQESTYRKHYYKPDFSIEYGRSILTATKADSTYGKTGKDKVVVFQTCHKSGYN